MRDSYYDTDASPGLDAFRRNQGSAINVHGRTTAELQSPTGAEGIYDGWDTTVWDFGTSSQYPALKVDFNGDGTATWEEFGFQVRVTLDITSATAALDLGSVSLEWAAAPTDAWADRAEVTHVLYRNDVKIAPEEGATLAQGAYTDESSGPPGRPTPTRSPCWSTTVEFRRGPARSVAVTRDTDGDGLIDITTGSQLNAIRYDLDGDGAGRRPGNDSGCL